MEDCILKSPKRNDKNLNEYTQEIYARTAEEAREGEMRNINHYENTPIQMYRKFHLQKLKIFRQKTLICFKFLLKT